MKIIDCFTYCGEDKLLELRLKTLNKHVDQFVIIEGNKYHNGKEKEKAFQLENFKEFAHKIKYFFITNFPEHKGNNWLYENFQRNSISKGLQNLSDEDLILISDLDEIPNLENEIYKKFDSTVFLQNMYYYKFNIHCYEGLKWKNKWPGTKACKSKYFKTAQNVREFRVKSYPWWRFDRKFTRHIENNGGWHFSFLMNEENISKKLQTYAHDEFSSSKFTDIKRIKNKINNLEDLLDRKELLYKKVEIDKSFPEELKINKDTYRDFIL